MNVTHLADEAVLPDASLVVAVCTRSLGSALLPRTLECLSRQTFPQGSCVLVVSNLSAEREGDTLEAIDGTDFPAPVWVAYEPTPGFSSVRNRALDAVVGAECVLFLDDDTVVESNWLEAMWRAHLESPQAVLSSLHDRTEVLPSEQSCIDALAGVVRRRGSGVTSGTNGLLLPLDVLGGRRFDPFYNDIGGEDTDLLLTLELAGHGRHIVPCLALEEDRFVRSSWMTDAAEAFRGGQIWFVVNHRHRLPTRGLRMKACAGLVPGALLAVVAAVGPAWARRRHLRKLAARLGVVVGGLPRGIQRGS